MNTEEIQQSETADESRRARWERIAEIVCKEFGEDPTRLRKAPQHSMMPWFQIFGVIGHFLRRDEYAHAEIGDLPDDKEIGEFLSCGDTDVSNFTRFVSQFLKDDAVSKDRPLLTHLKRITEAVDAMPGMRWTEIETAEEVPWRRVARA